MAQYLADPWTPPYEPDPLADVPALADLPSRAPSRCGRCGLVGHTAPTCGRSRAQVKRDELEVHRAGCQTRRARYLAAGRCADCGRPRAPHSRRRCWVCLDKAYASRVRARLRRDAT
jgi:hypothetical protein